MTAGGGRAGPGGGDPAKTQRQRRRDDAGLRGGHGAQGDPAQGRRQRPRVIAIDGPAGSGKSTVARLLAGRLGLECLDTGAMYRAVAYAVLRAGGDPFDEAFVASVARTIAVRMEGGRVIVDGVDATVEIRGAAVNRAVSAVATNAAVRSELAARQREWVRRRGGGVLEGRDIGTVVFPDAEVKIHLVASPDTRARRRARQSTEATMERTGHAQHAAMRTAAGNRAGHGPAVAEPAVDAVAVETAAADLARRDRIDSTRALDPLSVAEGAVIIDTTHATCEETIEQILELL